VTARFDLTGRVAVVTGGAQGLGAAIARALGEQGAGIALLDVQADAVAESAAKLARQTGQPAEGLACDVREKAQVDACIERIASPFGRIDVLVNKAGIQQPPRARSSAARAARTRSLSRRPERATANIISKDSRLLAGYPRLESVTPPSPPAAGEPCPMPLSSAVDERSHPALERPGSGRSARGQPAAAAGLRRAALAGRPANGAGGSPGRRSSPRPWSTRRIGARSEVNQGHFPISPGK
jgi:short chain dehydrogenase